MAHRTITDPDSGEVTFEWDPTPCGRQGPYTVRHSVAIFKVASCNRPLFHKGPCAFSTPDAPLLCQWTGDGEPVSPTGSLEVDARARSRRRF